MNSAVRVLPDIEVLCLTRSRCAFTETIFIICEGKEEVMQKYSKSIAQTEYAKSTSRWLLFRSAGAITHNLYAKAFILAFLIISSGSFFVSQKLFRGQAAKPSGITHSFSIPYYSNKGGWDSVLTLNNTEHEKLAASVKLYSLDGEPMALPDIYIGANEGIPLRLGDLISQSGNKEAFQDGSIEVNFQHSNPMALGAQLTAIDANHGLSFDVSPPMGLKSSTLESLWWSLDEKTTGQVMLSNTTNENLNAQLNVEWRGLALPAPEITFSAHQNGDQY